MMLVKSTVIFGMQVSVRAIALLIFAVLSCVSAGSAQELIIPDPLFPLRTKDDLLIADARKEVRLVVPRNGYASAPFVLVDVGASVRVIEGSRLNLEGDDSQSLDVRVRYALKAGAGRLHFEKLGSGSDPNVMRPYYDVLVTNLPSADVLMPVWLTVNPTADAKPGKYTGSVRVGEKGVPVSVEVAEWVCPDPTEWATHVGVLSSPETLALHYGVELWSDEHWGLVDKELALVGALGNKDLWLSAMPSNHLGQAVPWITFTRQDGLVKPDLQLIKKYLSAYEKRAGRPKSLLLELWNSNHAPKRRSSTDARVNVYIDGAIESVPHPGQDGSDSVWGPLLAEVRELVTSRGWDESSIAIGCANDARPSRKEVAFFKKHAPYAGWAIWTHGRGDPPAWKGVLKIGGMEVSHYEHLFCPVTGGVRKDGVTGGWDLSFPEYGSARNLLPKFSRPTQFRCLPDGMMVNLGRSSKMMTRNSAGFTRLCLDFWSVPVPDREGQRASLLLAYEDKPWNIFYRNNTRSIVEPGPDGPIATVRYEMLREGLQECEARVFLEKQLAAGALAEELEKEVRALLADRLMARESGGRFKGGHAGNVVGSIGFLWGVPEDWQSSTARLFLLAGKASRQLIKGSVPAQDQVAMFTISFRIGLRVWLT